MSKFQILEAALARATDPARVEAYLLGALTEAVTVEQLRECIRLVEDQLS